jgi:DNA-binding NarL/FixJ family response regulator
MLTAYKRNKTVNTFTARRSFRLSESENAPDKHTARKSGFTRQEILSRLVTRRYVEETRLVPFAEYSIRIQHEGIGHYFPLGTSDKICACVKAWEITRMVQEQGWSTVLEQIPREITLAVFWTRNPLCCTYTTLYSAPGGIPKKWLKWPPQAHRHCRTLIVHPKESVRRALGFWIDRQPGFYCAAAFSTLAEARASLAAQEVGVMLVDRSLMENPGGLALDQISAALPKLHVFGMGIYEESNYIFHSVTGVKSGYLLCRRHAPNLFDPIKILAMNTGVAPDSVVSELMKFFQTLFGAQPEKILPPDRELLTAREHDVLMGLTRGRSEKEVAAELQISSLTVHNHVKSIYSKLNAHSRTEAVVKYLYP